MRDFSDDAAVDGVFADINAVVVEHLRPAGVEAVYSTVRRRRRNRVIAGSALAVALVLGPAAGLALANSADPDKPPIGDSTTAPPPSPTAVAPTTPPASPGQTVPDGRISLAELDDATLEVGSWPDESSCPSGRVDFTSGTSARPPAGIAAELVGEPVYADVDGDGAEETAIVVECVPQWAVHQVMVYDRDGEGRIVLLGQVLVTTGAAGEDGVDIKKVWSIRAAPNGDISVDVGGWAPCCAMPADLPQHQWRTYGWNGEQFVQTGGPTAFGPNPKVTDLRADAQDVTLTKRPDGRYEGTLRVAIRNQGPGDAALLLSLAGSDDAPLTASVVGEDCAFTVGGPTTSCALGPLRDGATRTVRVTLVTDAPLELTLQVRVGNGTANSGYPDSDSTDNTSEVAVRTG